MKKRNLVLLILSLVVNAQDLTPRELFFAAPAIRAKEAAPQSVRSKVARPPSAEAVAQARVEPPRPANPPLTGNPPATVPDSPIVPAAYAGKGPPLGLRYSLLLSRDNQAYAEVDAASTFRSGDRLKVTVESNDNAYLYVIARGTSGLWKVLFPVSEVANGDNLIQAFRRYEVPNGGRFYFDDQAGEENLFLVLSRKPEKNFEDLIYSFANTKSPAETSVPQSVPSSSPSGKTFQMAGMKGDIDDALIGRVRQGLVARDLVFEKVSDATPGPSRQKETAVYVVNKNAGPDGKVMVDLKLEHR